MVDYLALCYFTSQLVKHVKSDSGIGIAAAIPPALLTIGGLYVVSNRDQIRMFFENFRLHPSRELGLEAFALTDKELEADAEHCISAMNSRVGGFRMGEVDAQTTINAVHDFMKRLYGFDTPATRRPKVTRNPALMSRTVYGETYPLTGEIVVVNPEDQANIAHEIAHTQGVKKESETELAAIVALLESTDLRLQYCGYSQWLNRLIELQSPKWLGKSRFTNMEEYQHSLCACLGDKGLNSECLDRMRKNWKQYESLAQQDTSGRLLKTASRGVNREIRSLDKFTHGHLGRHLENRGRVTQRSIKTRYAEKPVQLLHSYRVKYEP